MDQIDISVQDIQKHITQHPIRWYHYLMSYYRGEHPKIMTKRQNPIGKPDNRLVGNFPGYIVDVNLGYFLGIPIRYVSKTNNDEFLTKLGEIFEYNDEHDQNLELAKSMGIYGHTFEVVYFDQDGKIRFDCVDPENIIMVYDNSITPAPLYAIRFWYEEKFGEKIGVGVEVYTSSTIYRYSGKDLQHLMLEEEIENLFGDVPIIEYINNDERQCDFEKVLTQIDAYDAIQSNTANDFEYFSDAYLKIKGMMGTDTETINDMRTNRVILLSGDGDADWLIKHINDEALENYKSRVVEDIHKFSKTPNLADENFSANASGVALQYKLWGLEQNTAQKERKFKRGLQRRIELINNYLSYVGEGYDWRDIEITFSRNIPENLNDLVDMVAKLRGSVSHVTLLSKLPFIEDPELEIKRLQEESAESIDLSQFFRFDERDDDGHDDGDDDSDRKGSNDITKKKKK